MIVLDTCAVIWTATGDPMTRAAIDAINGAAAVGDALVPAIVLWEIPMLVAKGRLRVGGDVTAWVERVLAIPGFRVVALDGRAALDAATLPGDFHSDPADRFVVATARQLNAPVVTRRDDPGMGRAGHAHVVAA